MTEDFHLKIRTVHELKEFHRISKNKDKSLEYIFIDSGKILGVSGKEPSLMTTIEELKVDKARVDWKKLITQGWWRTKPVLEDSL